MKKPQSLIVLKLEKPTIKSNRKPTRLLLAENGQQLSPSQHPANQQTCPRPSFSVYSLLPLYVSPEQ